MKTAEFLEGIQVLEGKIYEKAGYGLRRFALPILVKQLENLGEFDKQIVVDFKKIWELRNKIYSSLTRDENVSYEAVILLTSLTNNLKQK